MVVRTVVHFEIPADNVEGLSKFYKDVFGWKFSKAPLPDMEYWLISTGPAGKSVPGGIYKKTRAQDGPRNFIQVAKIDEVIEAFKGAGGREMMGKQEVPNVGFTFIGMDPEGNMIGLHEPSRKSRRAPAKPKKSRR
ncbi:MAG: VOC family protein [Thaumarchaeota archaeon]|nr:VOC family protein [Nitrososphaerota archaeon]